MGRGCSRRLRNITLPLAMPLIPSVALFAFLLDGDEFFQALLFTADQRAKTLTAAIADLAQTGASQSSI